MISPFLKKKILNKDVVIGTFIKTGSETVVESLGNSGLDFVILDTEHAPYDNKQVENMIRAADCVNLPTIIRVPLAEESIILKSLDSGASGVQIPGIKKYENAKEIIKSTKYSPLGSRGLSFNQRSAKYGNVDKDNYIKISNENLINVIHIENKGMVESIEKLCNIKNIDVLFIGPVDLSQSYDMPGEINSEKLQNIIGNIVYTCKKNNKVCGIFVSNLEQLKKYKKIGIKYFALSSDIGFLVNGVKEIINK